MRPLAGLVLGALLLAGCPAGDGDSGAPATPASTAPAATSPAPLPTGPLARRVVVIDPGHQLGNRHFPSQINQPVDAGGFDKPCNTTGTSTDDGYAEATFVWRVAQALRRRLTAMGAQVVLTRSADSDARWGPCVDERGRAGNPDQPGPAADVKVSLHADGVEGSGAHGFHVIRPGVVDGWTDDIAAPSAALARAVRDALVAADFSPASYTGRRGIDVRTDLGTLNHADVPTVIAELGNMRDPDDARLMTSARGQQRYARALVEGIRAYLTR